MIGVRRRPGTRMCQDDRALACLNGIDCIPNRCDAHAAPNNRSGVEASIRRSSALHPPRAHPYSTPSLYYSTSDAAAPALTPTPTPIPPPPPVCTTLQHHGRLARPPWPTVHASTSAYNTEDNLLGRTGLQRGADSSVFSYS